MIRNIFQRLLNLLANALLLGLSLLPLSSLLLAYPFVDPRESVLEDAAAEESVGFRRFLTRIFALGYAAITLITLTSVAVEITSRLPLGPKGQFGIIVTKTLSIGDAMVKKAAPVLYDRVCPLVEHLPNVMVQHWTIVLLLIYLGDLLILFFIGKVPIAYNIRNIVVRWKLTSLTLGSFTLVVGLLVFMLGFVNGMNNLTQNTGVPGNVFVLSDGATDELFSNLGYGDIDNVERAIAFTDLNDEPLAVPVGVASEEIGGKQKRLASRETYYCINQPIPNSDPPRRRFVQLRSLEDADIAARVHKIELLPGGRWFTRVGVDNSSRIQCVLGEGIAQTLGKDNGKKSLEVGDTFNLGDMDWIVVGIMKSEATTFGSEIWAQRFQRIYRPFGKESFTTLVMRVEDNSPDSARNLARHLSTKYTQQKLKALSEPDYYAELTKTNNQILVVIVIMAGVMAVGGVFGMMTTMFASITQRRRDIGVLRLLGFKRWQILVSFMMESLTTGIIGGLIGVFCGWLFFDGSSATSTLSSGGGGGGKNFVVHIDIDAQIMAAGMLITLVMGRLGGLVPALATVRIKILDSLR